MVIGLSIKTSGFIKKLREMGLKGARYALIDHGPGLFNHIPAVICIRYRKYFGEWLDRYSKGAKADKDFQKALSSFMADATVIIVLARIEYPTGARIIHELLRAASAQNVQKIILLEWELELRPKFKAASDNFIMASMIENAPANLTLLRFLEKRDEAVLSATKSLIKLAGGNSLSVNAARINSIIKKVWLKSTSSGK